MRTQNKGPDSLRSHRREEEEGDGKDNMYISCLPTLLDQNVICSNRNTGRGPGLGEWREHGEEILGSISEHLELKLSCSFHTQKYMRMPVIFEGVSPLKEKKKRQSWGMTAQSLSQKHGHALPIHFQVTGNTGR